MQPFNGYKEAQPYVTTERLPIGGYVLEIKNVEEKVTDWGKRLVIQFDIAEGEQKDFYMKNWKAQTSEDKKWKGNYSLNVPAGDGSQDDEWKVRRFKTVMMAIEESNPGYHWDWNENGLKGKKIGGIFNDKEYEFNGRTGLFTNCHSLVDVEKIRSGNFTVPEPTLLKRTTGNPMTIDAGFVNIPDGIDEDLPFC